MIKCKFESGGDAHLRHVTVDCMIIKEGKVLLNKRGYYKGKPIREFGKWGLIGGFVDMNETINEAIRREAREEAGCELTNMRLFRVKDSPDPNDDRQNIVFMFVAHLLSIEDKPNEEVQELHWFDINDLPERSEIAFDHAVDLYLLKDFLSGKTLPEISKRTPAPLFE